MAKGATTPIIDNILPSDWQSQLSAFKGEIDGILKSIAEANKGLRGADDVSFTKGTKAISDQEAKIASLTKKIEDLNAAHAREIQRYKERTTASAQATDKVASDLKKIGTIDVSKNIDALLARLKAVRQEMDVYRTMMGETTNTGKKLAIRGELEKANEEAEALMRQITALEGVQEGLGGTSQIVPQRTMADEGELAQLNAYYAELEKTSAAEAKLAAQKSKTQAVADAGIVVTDHEIAQSKVAQAQKQKEVVLGAEVNNATTKEATNIAHLSLKKRELQTVAKLNAQIASSEAGSYNALDAQVKLNTLTLNKYSQEQIEASASLKKMQADTESMTNTLKTMDSYTGKFNRTVGNYSSALGGGLSTTKGFNNLTLQTTQIMRELPNFALDARIGFMSLSNNLPMFTDAMSRVANSIDTVTGKRLGWGRAIKSMVGGIFSMQTAVIILSTALIMYGKDIVKFISGTDKAVSSFDALKKVVKDGGGSFKSAAADHAMLGGMIEKYQKTTEGAEKIVDKYNETLGKYYGNVTDVNDAISGYIKQSPDYIKAIMAEAVAQQIANDTAQVTADRLQALNANRRLKNAQELKNQYAIVYAEASKMGEDGLKQLAKWSKDYGGFSGVFKDRATISGATALGEAFQRLLDMPNAQKFLGNVQKINTATAKEKQAFEQLSQVLSDVPDVIDDPDDKTGKKALSVEKLNAAYNALGIRSQVWMEFLKEEATMTEDGAEAYRSMQEALALIDFGIVTESHEGVMRDISLEAETALKEAGLTEAQKENIRKNADIKRKNEMTAFEKATMEHNARLEAINKTYYDNLVVMAVEDAKEKAAVHDGYLAAAAKSIEDYNKRTDEANKNAWEQEKDAFKEKERFKQDLINESYRLMAEAMNGYFDLMENRLDREAKKYEKEQDEELQLLEDKHDAGAISTEEYEREKAATEAYYNSVQEDLERQQFEMNKKRMLAEAWMQFALGTVRIWSEKGVNPVYAAILTGILAATTAVQTATIAAQEYATGGLIDAPQNTPTRPSGDNVMIYATRGETVITKEQKERLGGDEAMRRAGVPGYDFVPLRQDLLTPDKRDVGMMNEKTIKNHVQVIAKLESKEMLQRLDRLIALSSSKPSLMDKLISARYGN